MSCRRTVLLAAAAGFFVVVLLALVVTFVTRVADLRDLRATGPNWSFPSRVYSDAVPLRAGQVLADEYLLAELVARGYRPARRVPVDPGSFARVGGVYEIGLRGLPDETDPEGGGGPQRVRVRLAGGRLIAVARLGGYSGALPPGPEPVPRLEPVLVSLLFDEHRIWRTWVSLERVPRPVQDAIITSEDRRFYEHVGLDLRGSARALFRNLRSGDVREGGSTITQQLARGLFLGRERTLARKLAEMPLALGLELRLGKRQILEMYLNSVYWGQAQGFGVGGIAEAARWYFDAPVESLTVLQGATLAAMIPAPNLIEPFGHPAMTLERRNLVLDAMVRTGRLDAGVAARLRALPLGARRGPLPVERFPSYSDYVRNYLAERVSLRDATRRGLSIFTRMDLAWQTEAEGGVAGGLAALDRGRRPPLEGAFVALEPGTSAVRALVGGRRPRAGDFNRAYQARRQTGSAIKPIVYAAAFLSPRGLTPATTVADTLRTFGEGRWAWRPRNFDDRYHVQVTLAKALEQSLNVATSNVVDLIGPDEVAHVAADFGLGRLEAVPSIGLGSNDVSLLDLTNAFAVFPDGGMRHAPSPLRAVTDRTGRVLARPEGEAVQVVPGPVADLMTGLLENVARYGVAAPLRGAYGFQRPVAGKTGTTDDFKDAWFVGFTPDVVAGVWVGYDQPRSIGQQASRTALPIWARIVGRMIAGFPPAPFAADGRLQWADVDPWSGFLADSTCPAENTPFLPGTAPLVYCQGAFPSDYGAESADSLGLGDTTSVDTVPDEDLGPPAETQPAPGDTL